MRMIMPLPLQNNEIPRYWPACMCIMVLGCQKPEDDDPGNPTLKHSVEHNHTSFLILMAGAPACCLHCFTAPPPGGGSAAFNSLNPHNGAHAELALSGVDCAGVLSCKPNKKNPRDLDITLDYEFAGKNSSCSRTQAFRMR